MPRRSLEWNCEEVVMRKMPSDLRLALMEFRHHDTAEKAVTNTIVVRAVKGERQLEGPKAYAVTITATFASADATPEQADAVAAGMSEAIFSGEAFDPELTDLEFFYLEPGTETEREDTDHLRKRTVSFAALAKLTDEPYEITAEALSTSGDLVMSDEELVTTQA